MTESNSMNFSMFFLRKSLEIGDSIVSVVSVSVVDVETLWNRAELALVDSPCHVAAGAPMFATRGLPQLTCEAFRPRYTKVLYEPGYRTL